MNSYITYLSSDDYLVGVLTLEKQLSDLGASYPLSVLISDNISNKTIYALKKNNINLLTIDNNIEINTDIVKSNEKFGMPQWSNTFGKLHIFSLTQFKKLVYLDSDMLIKHNLDHLFDEPHLASVISGTKYPGNEAWSPTLNSGLMVIEPKKNEDNRLFEILNNLTSIKQCGDQDIIHMGYPDWPKHKELHLDEGYNLIANYESYYLAKGLLSKNKVAVIHYTGKIKPWMMNKLYFLKCQLGLIKRSIKVNKTVRGIIPSFKDQYQYFKLCQKVKRSMRED